MPPVRVATRGSALARWQAERVVQLLGVEAEYVIVSTRGDERREVPIHAMGGTGVFVKEVEQAVLDGRADIAVHSAKDLPAETAPELVLAALPERGDPRDAFVGRPFDEIPTGGCVGTGSVRRRAQLAALRPDLGFAELRGNVPTRLEKAAASTPSSSRRRRSTASVWPIGSPSAWIPRSCCPRSGQARWRSNVAPTTTGPATLLAGRTHPDSRPFAAVLLAATHQREGHDAHPS
jgi:porphobilinogen deaminase